MNPKLRAKMEDASHPMTKMLTEIYTLRENSSFKETSDDAFANALVNALKASQTEEHYEAMYALWDDSPFKDVARMAIRMIHKYVISTYAVGG